MDTAEKQRDARHARSSLVRPVDTLATRGGRAAGARAHPDRGVPPNNHQVEPVEGKKIDWPLFPGYCFARFDMHSRLAVLNRTGVVNIVSFNAEAAPIRDVEIDSLRQLIETDLQYDPCPMIREGMMVEVVHGPLQGVVGRLVRKGPHARLVLSVELINQGVSVEVDAADVKPY